MQPSGIISWEKTVVEKNKVKKIVSNNFNIKTSSNLVINGFKPDNWFQIHCQCITHTGVIFNLTLLRNKANS